MSRVIAEIRNFNKGIVDSFGRGKEPDGSFADSKNFVPTRQGSLETTHGYSTTGGLASLPTGFRIPTAGAPGNYNIAGLVAKPFPFASEKPSAYDGRIYFLVDDQVSPVNHVAVKPWYVADTAQVVLNSGFAVLDERKPFVGNNADITITNAATVNVITIANPQTNHELVNTDDYYNQWIAEFYDDSVGTGTTYYALVTDYDADDGGGNAVFTVLENIGTAGLHSWVSRTADDTITFRRWFHAGGIVPDFDTPPGECFEANGRVRGSGGASSDEDKFPWILQHIDREYFTGLASAGAPTAAERTYHGTYVDVMELKHHVPTHVVANIVSSPGYLTDAGVTLKFPDSTIFLVGWTLEYDGYEESRLSGFLSAGDSGVAQSYSWVEFSVDIPLAPISKRVTAVNIYAKAIVAGVTSQAYHMARLDLVNLSTSARNGGDETAQWLFLPNSAVFELDGSADSEARFNYYQFLNNGGSYFSRTGRVEENITGPTGLPVSDSTRSIVAWKNAEIVAGRLFVANFYDPNEVATLVDQVRYTGFDSDGISNYDVISWDRGEFELDVASGDPSIIRRLVRDQNWLNIFKDNSIYSYFISENPETWTPYEVSKRDGLYAVDSIVKVPERGIVFADVDQLKILQNQTIIPLTPNIETTYFNLTGKSSIVGWYDKIDRSIRFSDLVVASSLYTIWVGYLDLKYLRDDGRPAIPFYKVLTPDKPEFVVAERDESVLLGNQAATAVYKWHKGDFAFNATNITGYLKTNNIIRATKFMVVDKIVTTKTATAQGTLNCKMTIGGATKTWTAAQLGASAIDLHQKVAVTDVRAGRSLQYEFNTNASPAYQTSARTGIDAVIVFGEEMEPPNKSI